MAKEARMAVAVPVTREEPAVPEVIIRGTFTWWHWEEEQRAGTWGTGFWHDRTRPGGHGQITRAHSEELWWPVGIPAKGASHQKILVKYYRQKAQQVPAFWGRRGPGTWQIWWGGPVWRAVHPACALVHPRFLNPLPMPPLPLPTWNSNSNPSSNSSLIPKIRSHSTLLCGFPQDSAALLICHPALYLEASQSLESDTTLFKAGTTSDSWKSPGPA